MLNAALEILLNAPFANPADGSLRAGEIAASEIGFLKRIDLAAADAWLALWLRKAALTPLQLPKLQITADATPRAYEAILEVARCVDEPHLLAKLR